MGILAGAIGGFGTGLGRGLEQMQSGVQAYGLQQADRAFQMERLAEQNRFQAEQGDLTRKSAAANSAADRAQQLSLTDKKIAADLANTERTTSTTVDLAAERAKLDIELSKTVQETAFAAQKIQNKIADATIANDQAKLNETKREFNLLRPEAQDTTAKALIVSYGTEMTRLQATIAKLTADGLPISEGLTKEMDSLIARTKAMHKVIEGHMPQEPQIKMPGATPPPQEKTSLLDGAVPQPVGKIGVLRPGGVPVEQPAATVQPDATKKQAATVQPAAILVPDSENIFGEPLSHQNPNLRSLSSEQKAAVHAHNLRVDIQNLIGDVENVHRSNKVRTYNMTRLEKLANDSRISTDERIRINETIAQVTGNIRAGAR